jgi:hypothetical protein
VLKDFSQECFDVIIQAGQSNAEGYGQGKATEPFAQDGRIWYLNRDFTVSQAAERVWGNEPVTDFSLAFATEYIKASLLPEDRKVLIIRAAVGGTGFLDHRWGAEDYLNVNMLALIRTAKELNPKNRFVCFLWHQGETDAELGASFDTHYTNLRALVNRVRAAADRNDLPYISGNFVPHWRDQNAEKCEPVIRAMRTLCTDLTNAAFVESEGLLSNDQKISNNDKIHFCRDSLNVFGIRYFEAFQGIEKGMIIL